MERSSSQKFLRVVSWIAIVVGILGVLASIGLGMITGFTFGNMSEVVAETELTADEATLGAGALGIMTVIMLISSISEIISGVLGVRAASDNQKIMPVWVFSIIGLVCSVISLVLAIMDSSFNFSQIVTVAGAALMLWVANNVKMEAGK